MFELIQKDRYQIPGPVQYEHTEHEGCILTLPQTGVDWHEWLLGQAPSAQPVERSSTESIDHPVPRQSQFPACSVVLAQPQMLYPLGCGPTSLTAIITAHATGPVPVLAEMSD